MAGAVGAFWVSFDGRIRDAQKDADHNREVIAETRQDMRQDIRDINQKLDRLVEREE